VQAIKQLSQSAAKMASFWQALNEAPGERQKSILINQQASQLVLQSNIHQQLLRTFGIQGPFEQ